MRKFFLFVFLLPFILIDLQAQTSDLYFSEYIEGSSNNKALEIYNGTGTAVDLSNYQIAQAVNGGGWQYYHIFPTGATIADGDVWVIITDQVDPLLFDSLNADEVLAYPSVVHHNGNDARALIKIVGTDTTWLDIIGDPNNDPGSVGWDVAGVVGATTNHTLVRKPSVTGPNADWAVSAGIDSVSSEWLVYPQNTFKFLGFFGLTVDVTFEVDMGVQAQKGNFTVGNDVKISGNFNNWNNGVDVMTDLDGDTVYTISKTFNVGDTLFFKFIKNAGDWESDPNREYIVPAGNSTFFGYFDRDSVYAGPVDSTNIDVTFSCNMEFEIVSGRFNPTTDTLSVRGSFNGWGSTSLLFQSITDPNVYEGTFNLRTFEGDVFNYKYAYFGPGGTSWENDPNKTYTITADDINFGSAFAFRTFNDATLTTVTNFPVTIKFTVNMAGAISAVNLQPFPSIDDVRICGANAPLKWPDGGWPTVDSTKTIKLYDNGTNGDITAGDNIWSKDVTFPQYSPLRIQYKYGANWGLATNGGGNDNENGVGADHFIDLTSDLVSATVENVFGTMGTHPLVNIVTDVKELQTGTPVAYELSQNYPNPFNPSTQIRFAIPEAGMVNIKVFNTLGQEITTLVSDYRSAGSYEVDFNASNLTSGIYFYTITTNNFSETRKMMLLK